MKITEQVQNLTEIVVVLLINSWLQDFKDFIVDKTHFILPQYFIDASKLFESELCWNPFYKLFFLHLAYYSYSQAMSILEDIGNIGMKIHFVNIRPSNKEELEDQTNPKYFSIRAYLT